MRIKIFPFIKKDNHANDFFRLLNGVNTVFTTNQAIAVGERIGMPRAKVLRLLAVHSNDSFLRKIRRGEYEKLV